MTHTYALIAFHEHKEVETLIYFPSEDFYTAERFLAGKAEIAQEYPEHIIGGHFFLCLESPPDLQKLVADWGPRVEVISLDQVLAKAGGQEAL